MRALLGFLLLATSTACSSAEKSLGYTGGFDDVDLALTTSPKVAPPASAKGDSNGLGRGLAELSLALLEAGFIAPDIGPAPDIAYSEIRLLVGRERSNDIRSEVIGSGAELSLAITPTTYARVGFWVLDEEHKEQILDSEIGRLSVGLGHAIPLSESTHLAGSVGFQWERDRRGSVNFFSFSHDSKDGIFGSKESEFGFDADLALRHRLTSWLELDAGVRVETLREDSAGAFGNVRLFFARNAAFFAEYEDVDEPTFTAGITVLGSR